MSLITCPECGKQVSDKAPACIHCGYPLSSTSCYKIILDRLPDKNTYKGVNSDEYVAAAVCIKRSLKELSNYTLAEASRIIRKCPCIIFDGLSEENADALVKKFTDVGAVVEKQSSTAELDKRLNRVIDEQERGIAPDPNAPVMCPKCGSTQIGMHKVNYGLTLTLLGSNVMENVCQKCGHRWRPGKE